MAMADKRAWEHGSYPTLATQIFAHLWRSARKVSRPTLSTWRARIPARYCGHFASTSKSPAQATRKQSLPTKTMRANKTSSFPFHPARRLGKQPETERERPQCSNIQRTLAGYRMLERRLRNVERR